MIRRWLYVLYATMDDSHCSSRQAAIPPEFEKEHVKCVVHRIPNDRMTAASQTQPGRLR
jgi:hypothetical protein